MPLLTTDSEGATGQDFALAVFHSVISLVQLRHSLCHPDLSAPQQPSPARTPGARICLVPQHNWHCLWLNTTGRKF